MVGQRLSATNRLNLIKNGNYNWFCRRDVRISALLNDSSDYGGQTDCLQAALTFNVFSKRSLQRHSTAKGNGINLYSLNISSKEGQNCRHYSYFIFDTLTSDSASKAQGDNFLLVWHTDLSSKYQTSVCQVKCTLKLRNHKLQKKLRKRTS